MKDKRSDPHGRPCWHPVELHIHLFFCFLKYDLTFHEALNTFTGGLPELCDPELASFQDGSFHIGVSCQPGKNSRQAPSSAWWVWGQIAAPPSGVTCTPLVGGMKGWF